MRPAVGDAADMAGMRAACLVGADPDDDLDAGLRHRASDRRRPPAGFGSAIAETTREMPAAMTASAQGGVVP